MLRFLYVFSFVFFMSVISSCKEGASKEYDPKTSPYLNIREESYYVGKETCKGCHLEQYNTFIHTGMGASFDTASIAKSKGSFDQHKVIYDSVLNLYYSPFWKENQLFVKEYRLFEGDTVHLLIKPIHSIIGSGQHTNSHLISEQGYLFQAPFTFYAQKGILDFPPGFEKGANSRFSRMIELECMTCHNAYPKIVDGSLNKYESIPDGIDCERCHGAGSIHVAQKQQGILVDTEKEIDYSIVNPSKLELDLQFDICQRCHLQGNTILKEGKTFYDFKPGMPLHTVMETFLPKYSTYKEDFIMASHADRLKMSACFIKSKSKADNTQLRPYKKALTCISCHNPHISVQNTNQSVFNTACTNCHIQEKIAACSEQPDRLKVAQNNCVSCHMPKSTSTDIPHVTVHDHYIRKHLNQSEHNQLKTFVELYCVNNPNPDALTRAKAFMNQYEKFEDKNPIFLDSALQYLKAYPEEKHLKHYAKLYHLKQQATLLTQLVTKIGIEEALKSLVKVPYDNSNAWSAYYIAQAFEQVQQPALALQFYQKANLLAPYAFEFTNKLAHAYLLNKDLVQAKSLYQKLIKEVPSYALAQNNLGYIFLLEGNYPKALPYFETALHLDPNYELAYLNKANCYLQQNQLDKALNTLKTALKHNPKLLQLQPALQQLQSQN